MNTEIGPIFSAMMRSKTGVILITLQIALTLAILANALYVVRDRTTEANRASGLDDANTFVLFVFDKDGNNSFSRQKQDIALLQSISGVVNATVTSQAPLSQSGSNTSLRTDPKQTESSANSSYYIVSDSFVDTLDLDIIEGRNLNADDMQEIDESLPDQPEAKVALVTKALAQKLYPNEKSVIGKPFYREGESPIQIVGVIDNLVDPWGRVNWNGNLRKGDLSFVLPALLKSSALMYIVHTEPGQTDRVMKDAEKSLLQAVPGRMLLDSRSMDTIREDRYQGEHTVANGMLIVIGLLLLMTASGIIGLASLWVNQRRKQIGIRRALGARKFDILRYFITENTMISFAGVAIGTVLAIALNRLMMDQLELQRLPIVYLLIGAAVLLILGVSAVFGPAWRAAQIPPAIATRSA